MITPYTLLLIENKNLDQTRSLYPKLEEQKHHVLLISTPEEAVEKISTRWPNLIVFNLNNDPLVFTEFQEAIDQLKLDLPYLVIGNKENLPPSLHPDTVLISPDKPQQLIQGITKAISIQRNRFIRLVDLVLDCQQSQVLHQGVQHSLTPKEFKLLQMFLNRHDEILTRKEIMQQVWETDYMGDTRTLDVHVRWVRKKTEVNPSSPSHLKTVRGEGYIFITKTR